MKAYIQGWGAIGPDAEGKRESGATALYSAEPDYSRWLDPRQSRRMSRIQKMGLSTAFMALEAAGLDKPDAIVCGSGYGCLEDTGIFLSKMISQGETALNPTPFIQSTHNTIAALIALLLDCQGYNQTYTQGHFSFEQALADGLLLLEENPDLRILAGGFDEMTEHLHRILLRCGLSAANPAGEGSAFFVIGSEKPERTCQAILDVQCLYRPEPGELEKTLQTSLDQAGVSAGQVRQIYLGAKENEAEQVSRKLFPAAEYHAFKDLCGEYPTTSAWGLSRLLQSQPEQGYALLLNSSPQGDYTFILSQSCPAAG